MAYKVRVDMKNDGYQFLVATEDINKNEEIIRISGIQVKQPAMHSMHTSMDSHTLIDNISRYVSHECFTSNSYYKYDCKPWALIASRDIKANEPITYDYATSEFKMASEFICNCGNESCRGEIKGFGDMCEKDQERLINTGYVSPVVMALHKASKE